MLPIWLPYSILKHMEEQKPKSSKGALIWSITGFLILGGLAVLIQFAGKSPQQSFGTLIQSVEFESGAAFHLYQAEVTRTMRLEYPKPRFSFSGNGVGGVIIDDGTWLDLGNRESYLEASAGHVGEWADEIRIHPDAIIDPSSQIDSVSVIGAGATVGAGATIECSILWGGAVVEAAADLKKCIVRTGETARGILRESDC